MPVKLTGKAEAPREAIEKNDEMDSHCVAIVITVHGALDYLVSCLETWRVHTENSHVLLVDDCETTEESEKLEKLASSHNNVTVVAKSGTESVGYVLCTYSS